MRVLEDPQKFFWLKSGKGLRSVKELADAFPKMPDAEFSHHVHAHKNDFALWVDQCLNEPVLAERLRTVHTKSDLQSIIYNWIIQSQKPKPEPKKASKEPLNEDQGDVIHDPQAFIKYHERDSVEKDALADRFDTMARTFEEHLNPETPERVEKRIEMLQEEYEELRRKISDARREGKDCFIPELILKPFQSKMKYASVTQKEADFEVLDRLLVDARAELEEAVKHVGINVKDEIMKLVEAR